jgi:branched-chain amino acid transport system substrate-binding protein
VVPRGATTAMPQMQKLRAANPEAMFLAGVLTAENVLIFRAYKELGVKFPIHSSYNLSVPIYESVAKGLIDGITFVDAYDPEKPEVKAFVEAYKKGTGKEPVNLAWLRLRRHLPGGRRHPPRRLDRQGEDPRGDAEDQLCRGDGREGMKYSFPEGKRAGFDPNGMVVRVYEKDRQGRVLHVGTK